MTDRELIYIKTIFEEKSIAKASRKLSVAEPSVSQAVQRIEAELGTKLFVRTPMGLKPTFHGEEYYKVAVDILKTYERFETRMHDLKNGSMEKVRFGIAEEESPDFLPAVLAEFVENYPEIQMDVKEDLTANIVSMLSSKEIDFSIQYWEDMDGCKDASYETVFNDELVLIVSKDHDLKNNSIFSRERRYPIVNLKELKNHKLIKLYKSGLFKERYESILEMAGIDDKESLLTTHYLSTAVQLALKSAGVVICPRLSLPENTPSDCILSLPDSVNPYIELVFMYPKDSFPTKSAEAFLKCVKKHLVKYKNRDTTLEKRMVG